MATTERNPVSPDYGQSVRGFRVLFTHPDWKRPSSRFHSKAGKVFSLPCSGFAPYTGEEALRAMRSYARKGFTVMAATEANGFEEQLTIEEMSAIYGKEI